MQRKRKILIYSIIILTLCGVIFFSFYYVTVCKKMTIIKRSPLRIELISNKNLVGTGYDIGNNKIILIVKNKDNMDACYIDIQNKTIGLPSFDVSKYYPFKNIAFVDNACLEGFPEIGELRASFERVDNTIYINVTGPSGKADADDIFYQTLLLHNCKIKIEEAETRGEPERVRHL